MNRKKIFKELDNYWYHYKFHTLAGAFIVVIVLFMIFSGSPQKDAALKVVLMGNAGGVTQQQKVQQNATEQLLGKTESDSIIQMAFWPTNGDLANPQNRAYGEKLMAMVATGSVDVLVLDQKAFHAYAKQGFFKDLGEVKEKIAGDGGRFSAVRATGPDHQEHIFGIEASQSGPLKKAGYPTENKVIAIVTNSKHPDLAIRFIKWLI